jgi:hypothetical protein
MNIDPNIVVDFKIDAAEMARRQRDVDWARAANMRQGYIHDPVLEAINQRYIRGDISLDGLHQEIMESIQAGR